MQKLIASILLLVAMFYASFAEAIGPERETPTAIITLQQITTPSNPSSGFNRIYSKGDDKLYTLNSAGDEVELGAGGAGGNVLNLLADGSFEDDVTAVTCSSCTATQETSVVLLAPFNLSSLKAAFTASTGSFFDDELTGSQYTGVQGKLSLWLKTDQSGVVVYPRCDGAGITSLSVDVASDNKWHLYEIPFVMCGTSNGYQVEATASITGNIYADDIFLGASDPTTNIGIDTPWQDCGLTTADFQGFGTPAAISLRCRRDGSDLKMIGSFTTGTATATEGRIGLRLAGEQLTTASNLDSVTNVGNFDRLSAWGVAGTRRLVAASSETYLTFHISTSGNALSNPLNGSDIGSSEVVAVNATIPIANWSASTDIYTTSAEGSNVRLDTANGYGSTATRIRRFTNERVNFGSGIEYVDSATDGASFTATRSGFYFISYSDQSSAAAGFFGLSLNASDLTQNIESIAVSELLAIAHVNGTASSDYASTSWVGWLSAGDIVRAHTNANLNGTKATFSIVSFSDMLIGLFKDVVTSPGSSNGKPVQCFFTYGGASETTVCSGTCTEYEDTCGGFGTVTRGSAGVYSVIIADGTFANNSSFSCSGSVFGSATSERKFIPQNAGNLTTRVNASGGGVMNFISASPGGGVADTFGRIKCEGTAP